MGTVVRCNNCGGENTIEGLQTRFNRCWMCRKEITLQLEAKYTSPDYLSRKTAMEFVKNTEFMSGWMVRYYEESGANWVTIGFPFTISSREDFDRWATKWGKDNKLKEKEVNGYFCEGCESIFAVEKIQQQDRLDNDTCPYCGFDLTVCERVD